MEPDKDTLPRAIANEIAFMVSCISDFANRFGLKQFEAYSYLRRYLGLDFLRRHYEALHTLSIDEAVDDLIIICQRNGGGLAL